MTETNNPKHPGKIVFIDGTTQEVTAEVDAETVPLTIRFVETDDGLAPVVKIVNYTTEGRRIIRQYGPNDELLKSTVQIATP
ncbi:MAG: hypothetical protein R3E79_04150 [Caldilineaceae bacterium]